MNLKNTDFFDFNLGHLEKILPILASPIIPATTFLTANIFVTTHMFLNEIEQIQKSETLKNNDLNNTKTEKDQENAKDDFFIKTFLPTNYVELNQKVVLSKNLPSYDSRLLTKMEGKIVKIRNKSLKNVVLQFNPKKFYVGNESSILPFFTPRV